MITRQAVTFISIYTEEETQIQTFICQSRLYYTIQQVV